ncbi:hypothetical protein MMC25_001965 [Agyrium rufum]|nr:hypothetical protein [Agyrium rufum]
MPPRKKQRLSPAATSVVSQASVDENPPMKRSDAIVPALPDPWTDEQEISLFKGMMRWKPVGMHKHFRMIALSQYLRNHGYTSPKDGHTRVPGIWKKLADLYNLEALDEREDAFGDEDNDPSHQAWLPFKLPKDEFEDMMLAKRINPASSSSPPAMPQLYDGGRRASTIADSEDPRSSPTSAQGSKTVKGSTRRSRKSRLQEEVSQDDQVEDKEDADDETKEDDEDEAGDEEETPAPTRGSSHRGWRGGGKRGRGGRFRGGRPRGKRGK